MRLFGVAFVALSFFVPYFSFATERSDQSIDQVGNAQENALRLLFDASKWLTPAKMNLVVYPMKEFRKGNTGHVDVKFRVDQKGRATILEKPVSTPPNDEFEKASIASMRHWRFWPPVNQRCEPTAAEGRIRVWYELKNGVEVVSVSSDSVVPTSFKRVHALNASEVQSSIKYPETARRQGVEGVVYSVITIDSETGVTKDAKIVYRAFELDDSRVLDEEVLGALMKYRVAVDAPHTSSATNACVPMAFYLTD